MTKIIILLVAGGCLLLAGINLSSRAKHVPGGVNDAVSSGAIYAAKPVNTQHIRCIADCDSYYYVADKFYTKATTKPVPYAHLDWFRGTDARYDYRMTGCEQLGIGTLDLSQPK